MESSEAESKRLSQRLGTAYVVIRQEKKVDELGADAPSLVPYSYSSSEDEKDETFDHSQQQYSQPDCISTVDGACRPANSEAVPKSGISNDSNNKDLSSVDDIDGTHAPDLSPSISDYDLMMVDDFSYRSSDDEDEYDDDDIRPQSPAAPTSPREYSVQTAAESGCDSLYIDILKDYGCETCFIRGLDIILPGWFSATLHKKQAKKLKGDKRVRNVYPKEYFCEC